MMKLRANSLTLVTLAVLAALPAGAAFACATCGCSLSSDAALGYSAASGFQVSLQYDYINQNQLRSGSGPYAQAQLAATNVASGGNGPEVENKTVNRYLTLGLAYAPSADWNLRTLIPYIDRDHTTYGNPTSLPLDGQLSSAHLSALGDIKFIASYQGFLPTHNLGFQLGLKLPTGNYGGMTDSGTTVGRGVSNFNAGPAAGSPLDASLQAGNGSTDLILGAYYYQAVSQNFDAFINGQYQSSIAQKLNQSGADYRPGDSSTLSVGLRYEANPEYVPQLQLNLSRKAADRGALADTGDTAGTTLYLSPGITVNALRNTHVYAFLQLPVYSKLAGYQLFPHWTATLGMSYNF